MPTTSRGTFVHGRKSAIGTAALQLTATSSELEKSVLVIADSGNTTKVYVGLVGVTADAADGTDGFPLAAGDSIEVEINDPSKVYVIGDGAGPAKVFFVGV